jgi:hypothetical protein
MAGVDSLLRTQEISLEQVRKLAESGYLYAVVDAASVPLTPKKVLEWGEERAVSLYRGSAEEQYWDVAPYLLRVDPAVLEWIVSISSKEGWGILVAAKVDLEALRKHFRHFLRVKEPGGETWLFRFYDPRVLRPFLSSCSGQELRAFFGPIRAFGLSAPEFANVSFLSETTPKGEGLAETPRPQQSLLFELRPEHVEALRPQAEAHFHRRLVEYIRRECSTAVGGLSNEVLAERIESGVKRARAYGITEHCGLATFVAFMFEFAPDFDKHPHVQGILTDSAIHPDDRIHVVADQISDEEWEAVETGSSGAGW